MPPALREARRAEWQELMDRLIGESKQCWTRMLPGNGVAIPGCHGERSWPVIGEGHQADGQSRRQDLRCCRNIDDRRSCDYQDGGFGYKVTQHGLFSSVAFRF